MKKHILWQLISGILGVLLLVSFLTYGFRGCDVTGASVTEVDDSDIKITILNDKRCDSCDTSGLMSQLNQLFPDAEVLELDYNDKEGKELYEDTGKKALPLVLFNDAVEQSENYANVENYLEESGDYLSLKIGSKFDPTSEICDNGIDDTGNGKVDCEDESCSSEWKCMEKKAVPEVELFVMSHCPYGTQTEKGMLPVAELLGDKIDFEIKYVNYAMHGKEELDEQTLQYCIQKEQNSKFLKYIRCFLENGKTDKCLEETDIDETKLDSCIEAADKEYKITELFEDQSTWSGGRFPQFNIHKEECEKYGIRGSPGLAVNGVNIPSFGRDPASLLSIVCTAFKEKPEECSESLSSASPSPGFGWSGSGSDTQATCG